MATTWKQISFSDHTHSYAPTASPTFTGTATFGGDVTMGGTGASSILEIGSGTGSSTTGVSTFSFSLFVSMCW